jgi:hypothetical protein
VLVIHDLAAVVPAPVPARAAQLQTVWSENWEGLGKDDESSVNRIDDAIGSLREGSLAMLRALR